MRFAEKWNARQCGDSGILLAWMGQAGFLIRNQAGKTLALDVYLSDLVERADGNKRFMMAPCDPEELHPDLVLASHEHLDHLDLDTIPVWLNQGAQLICNEASRQLCLQDQMREEQITVMREGDVLEKDGFCIEAVFADHGDTAPGALGFLIRADGVTVYFTGDTSYQTTRMAPMEKVKPTVMIAPINGEYGNMNERDVAMLAAQLSPKVTIPCHFGMFARHRGSAFDFLSSMRFLAPDEKEYVMGQGEILEITAEGIRFNEVKS